MPYEVYLIESTETDKKYIGITTKGYEQRFANHVWHSRKSRKSCRALYAAINKYGASTFRVRLIDTAKNREDLCAKEIYYISKLNTLYPNGYNLTLGGDAGSMSDDTKRMMSERLKGVPLSEHNKAGLKRAWEDPEIRKARVEAIKAAMNRPEVRAQTSERQKGVKKSKAHVQNLRKAKAKKIKCIETGEVFDAIVDAVSWIKSSTKYSKANHAKIIRALKGEHYTAYGYHWSRA